MSDGRVNILIVDDKPEKLLALEALLEDLGQNIVRAYSGREALRALLNDEFAVILLDVNMPGMDGFETAQLIRRRQSTQHVPIIFITAFGDENHAARGYQLGAVDYIQTPVVGDVLKTKVSVFVDLYRKTAQVQRQAEWQRRRAAQLQKLSAAVVAINGARSVETMLRTVTDTARDLVGSHQAITLYLLEPAADGQRPPRTQSFTSFSDKYAQWRDQRLNLDLVATTMVARGQSATRMSEAELREHPDWDVVAGLSIPPVQGGMLAAPLVSRAGPNLGVIYLCDRYEGQFTHDDEAILTQLAQMTSVAIENAIFAEERETNRIKDEFLSTLSHELRTPLNAILGWTQLLRLSPDHDQKEIAHAMEVIERNARAQAKLVEDLLDVSRVSTGKLRLNARPLSLSTVVSAAADAVRPLAEEKQLTLECVALVEGDADRIDGDADRLQQVVWNLLNNAVKFTPAGGRVEVRLDRLNGHLRLRVTDTGRGIAPSFLPYVFDRFRQADATSTRSHGGLGIGLTIVRHIVELHGGTVIAESPGEGRGATFVVTLPVKAAPQPSATTGPAQDAAEAKDAPPAAGHERTPDQAPRRGSVAVNLNSFSVIVVDDEPDARDVIARILRSAGADAVAVGSVREALDAIARQRPDAIVSDIAMPDQDGYELARILRERADSTGGAIPALALTAYAREEDRTRALDCGFVEHLAKPVEPGELLSAVARLVAPAAAAANGNGRRPLSPHRQPELKYG